MSKLMNRRQALATTGLSASGFLLAKSRSFTGIGTPPPFRHSVCRWCFNDIPLETLVREVQAIGIASIELLTPAEWPTVYAAGLQCAVATNSFISLTEGFNNPQNHQRLQRYYPELMQQAADQGIPQVICFSGNRRPGLTDEQGLDFCAQGLAPLVRLAEELDILLIMELLNSKVDHPGHQCDRTSWGVQLVDKIGSPHFKLLYDIYHMQVMEGNIIATIRQYANYFAHYHTAGVPGRNEIDDTQELNYSAIVRAIAETGFKGYLGQEFIPKKDKNGFLALREAIATCTPK